MSSTNTSNGTGAHGGVAEKLKGAGHVVKGMATANKDEAQRGVQQMSSGTGGGAPHSKSDDPITLGSGAARTSESTSGYLPSGVAGAGGAQSITASVGGTLPQGQYEGYPSQEGTAEMDRGAARNAGRNDREFETKHGPPAKSGTLPREDGPLPAADATSSGPGTGVPSGGPSVLP
ncbi:hypothetical protein EVJ58_g1034 [Rhodofomes roseus]|uniref:Uncharacterized protein n=1 Tax=Rhodofomes roseus TaxID=34475 RepID=A0A4Y9Z1A5_9APHY|nr:hypothetical protein EVJ58_g1034 [Rhodofomes roseus]